VNRTLEISIGVILVAFAAFMYWESFNPIYRGFGQPEFPPMRFPRWILIGIGGLAALHVARTTLGLVKTDPIFSQTLWLRTLLVAIATLIGALLIKPIGFTFASMLTFWTAGWLLGYRNPILLILYGTLFALGTWAVFTFLIKLGLPTSPLFYRI
jgi:hypothetical protein